MRSVDVVPAQLVVATFIAAARSCVGQWTDGGRSARTRLFADVLSECLVLFAGFLVASTSPVSDAGVHQRAAYNFPREVRGMVDERIFEGLLTAQRSSHAIKCPRDVSPSVQRPTLSRLTGVVGHAATTTAAKAGCSAIHLDWQDTR